MYSYINKEYSHDQEELQYRQDQLAKAFNDGSSDEMYDYYHEYFNQTEVVYYKPSLEFDYLKVPVYYYTLEADECQQGYLNAEDGEEYVRGNGTVQVRSDFKYNETKHVYVSEAAAAAYLEIYEEVVQKYDRALAMFNFELIVYDETEFFRNAGDPLFDYPYSN
jgi:hypothetical protein